MSSEIYIRKRKIEEYGYVLYYSNEERYIKIRRYDGTIKEIRIVGLIGQILGEFCFTLMEFQLNRQAIINELERIYIGKGPRTKVIRFIRYISYDDLSYRAKENLPKAIEKAVIINEDYWVNFFNKAGPLTMRMHTLELLKNIGKKTVLKIIEEREKEPFKSFEDIRNRINIDPVKVIVDRVLEELREKKSYYLFICPAHS